MDRLSELPDSLIFHMFWFLPMIDVVRTTILSKRWKNLWTTTPFLNFENYTMRFDDTERLQNFVNPALSHWNGERVLKFKLESCHKLNKSMSRDINLWVRFAMENEVEELYLHLLLERESNMWERDDVEIYWVTPCLYSCSSLKVLSFKYCYFRVDGNVQWNQLKSLTIIEGFGLTGDMISQMLSGSPQLEVLIMSFIESDESFCIRSSSLKELSIYKCSYDYEDNAAAAATAAAAAATAAAAAYDLSLDTELRVWTPNLETLDMKGIPFKKCLLMNVSSLTRATIGFSDLHYYDDDDYVFPGIDIERGLFSPDDFLGEGFCQILQTIQHVENVALLFCCIKVLEAMITRCMNSSFPNVISLQLGYCYNDYEQLIGVFEIFPQLKKLILQVRKEDEYHDYQEALNFDAKSCLKFEASPPKPFLLQLRTVEVTWVAGDNVFPFLEFLLKYASKLEKMVFRVKEITPPSSPSYALSSVSEKLLRMPRSSPTAQLIFCEN